MPWLDPQKKRDADRIRVATRRREWVTANGPCRGCGCDDYEQLEVDHVDPTQKVDHKVWSWREDRRLVELAKCQVLCVECHGKKTTAQTYEPVPHGTNSRYKSYRCRCAECRAAHAVVNARYKHRKPVDPGGIQPPSPPCEGGVVALD